LEQGVAPFFMSISLHKVSFLQIVLLHSHHTIDIKLLL